MLIRFAHKPFFALSCIYFFSPSLAHKQRRSSWVLQNHLPVLPRCQITPLVNDTNSCKPQITQPHRCHYFNERESVTVSIKRIWVDYSSNLQSFLICGSQKDFQGRCTTHRTLSTVPCFIRHFAQPPGSPRIAFRLWVKSLKTLHSIYRGSNDAGRHLHKEQGMKIQSKVCFYYTPWKQLDAATGAIYSDEKN